MNTTPNETVRSQIPPQGIAVSGIVFSALYAASLILLRLAVPADPKDAGIWLSSPEYRSLVHNALNLLPFAGIAFLWFMGVLRHRIGLLEDRFFATIFLGSGLLFVAMMFGTAAVSRALLDTFGTDAGVSDQSDTYRVARGIAYSLTNTFGNRMAAVFMFVTSTIGLHTAVLPRWISCTGFVSALAMLFLNLNIAWIALLFPVWVLTISIYILCSEFRSGRRGLMS